METAIVEAHRSGLTQIIIHNNSGFTRQIPKGVYLGEAEDAEVLTVLRSGESDLESAVVDWIASGTES